MLLRDADLENNFVAVLTFGAQVHEPHFDTTQQHVSEAMVLFKTPESQTLNPKSQILNPKPQTSNPELQTPKRSTTCQISNQMHTNNTQRMSPTLNDKLIEKKRLEAEEGSFPALKFKH